MTTRSLPWQRRYPQLERPWLIALLVTGTIGAPLMMVGLGRVGSLVLLLTIGAFVVVPRFARVQVSGMVGGLVTGVFVLGIGLRVAMRIVVLTDDIRDPVFTSETLFLLFFGGVVGLAMGPIIAVAQRLWTPRGTLIGAVVAALSMTMFLLSPDLRQELFNEGVGAVLNIPLFTLVFFGFGWMANGAIRWIEPRLPWTPGRDLDRHDARLLATTA